ncbi:MAG: hypothetical protein IAF02_14695 [Anaerolineae bacterium]|nr:hypothetical protein [Anaerolineae bacterium]
MSEQRLNQRIRELKKDLARASLFVGKFIADRPEDDYVKNQAKKTLIKINKTLSDQRDEMDQPIIITRNGQAVECWGQWEEDSNADCVFDDERLDGTWCDGANNWTEVVEELTTYALRMGTKLIQLEAC